MPDIPRKSTATTFGPYLALGIQLALSVIVFFFIGRWLDDKFDTSPWLMILGLVVGTAGGFIQFFRTVISLEKEQEKGGNGKH